MASTDGTVILFRGAHGMPSCNATELLSLSIQRARPLLSLISAQHRIKCELQVVVRGKLCKVVGYGGMNMHMIDITSVPDARVSCRPACALLSRHLLAFTYCVRAYLAPLPKCHGELSAGRREACIAQETHHGQCKDQICQTIRSI